MSEIEPAELARTLRRVQEFDTGILRLRREIAGLEDKHNLGGLHEELEDGKQLKAEKESELAGLEHKQHKLDGEVDLLSQKIKTEEEKLFSGTIMNPKELSAIQAEILSLRKKRDEMETEDLEEMEAIDSLHDEVRRSGALVEQVADRERSAKGACEEELAEKERELAELEAQREELKAKIDEETLAAYEKLLEQKDGLAVVEIIQGRSCGGCRIEFSRTQIDRFQHEEGIWRCEYCRRILVK